MKDLPYAERPYEKLELYGQKNLSNAELLAIIIKTGTKDESSVEIAQKILKMNKSTKQDELNFLRDISLEELMQIKGIGRVKAIQLKAMCEIAVRMSKPSNYKQVKIVKPSDLAKILFEELRYEKREIAKLVTLNNKKEVNTIIDIALGGENFVNLTYKNVLSQAIRMQAPKIILVHNHPSGDCMPSQKDIEFTFNLYDIAEKFDIELIDHIVIGISNYTSIFELFIEKADDKNDIGKKDVKIRKEK